MFLPFPAPVRRISPCQAFTATDLQQRITAGAAGLLGPLRAIPGVTAAVRNVMVDCAANTVVIPILINYRSGGISARATIRIFGTLEPLAAQAVNTVFAPVCVTVRGRFFDLLSLPADLQQRIQTVVSMIFSRTVCFGPRQVLGQALQ